MKNNIKSLIFGFLVMFLFSFSLINLNFDNYAEAVEDEQKIILIDPGHGGLDGGASASDGTVEKHINLNISLELAKELKEKGYTVFLTREEDKGLYSDSGTTRDKKNQDLNERCKLKKDTNCDLFISIHLNKFSDASCKGAQVWYSQNPESEKIAKIIQSNIVNDLENENHRLPKAAKDQYKILRNNDTMAGVIVECGFLSNNEDLAKLKDESYQKKLAQSLCKSIVEYFENSN